MVRNAVEVLRRYVGKDITDWFSHYYGGDFPVRYTLQKVTHRDIVVTCKQGQKVWDIRFRPSVFFSRKVDWDYAPADLRKAYEYEGEGE